MFKRHHQIRQIKYFKKGHSIETAALKLQTFAKFMDLKFTWLYLTLPDFTWLYPTLPDFTRLYPTLPDFTRLYPTLPDIYPTLPDFTRLYPTLPDIYLTFPDINKNFVFQNSWVRRYDFHKKFIGGDLQK